jgi:exonuclease III
MSVLSWNCRGLGNPGTVQDLHRLVKEKKPDLVFLMETKMINKKCDPIRIKLGFDYLFCVDCVGRSGGLILMWKDNFNVVIQNYSRRHINAVIAKMGLIRDGNSLDFMGTLLLQKGWSRGTY